MKKNKNVLLAVTQIQQLKTKKYVNKDKQIKAAEYVEPNNPLFSDDWYDQKENDYP